MDLLKQIWQQLHHIQHFQIRALSLDLDQIGEGSVETLINENQILFREEGMWLQSEISFTSTLLWKRDQANLFLDHLRYGKDHPVSLFQFSQLGGKLISLHPHLCKEDRYESELFVDQKGLHLSFHVMGPKKNDQILILYS